MGAFFDRLTAFGQPLTIVAVLMRIGVAVVIGNEGSGLSTGMIEACGKTVFIPISARSESLNASVAASIFLWEMRRRG